MGDISKFIGLTSSQSSKVLGSAQETTPGLASPMASGLRDPTAQNSYTLLSNASVGGGEAASTTSTSLVDAVNVTGAGILEIAAFQQGTTGQTATMVITIDGVIAYSGTVVGAASFPAKCIVGTRDAVDNTGFMAWSCGHVPFKTSLRIQHSTTSGGTSIVRYKYWRSA